MILYFLAKGMFGTCADGFSIPIPGDELIASPQIINWRYKKMHKPGKRDQCQNKKCRKNMYLNKPMQSADSSYIRIKHKYRIQIRGEHTGKP